MYPSNIFHVSPGVSVLLWLQFEGFARGFMMVVGGPAVHLFSPMELERLVSGNPILDFKALQANARYDGGYSADHRVRVQLSYLPETAAFNM